MKKILLASLLLFFVISGRAQDRFPHGFRLGLTAHPTFGWVKSDQGSAEGFNLGFSYGLTSDFNFAEHYSFTTGLTVTTINGKLEEVLPQGTVQFKYMTQYIEIPLTLKLKTSTRGQMRGYGQFGLSNGFNISSRVDDPVTNVKKLNIKDDTNFYRAGLLIGAGMEFDIDDHTSLVGGLTFNNGFTDFADFGGRSVRNHYIGLNFGIFF